MNPPDLPEDEKRKVIEAALGMKDVAETKSFDSIANSLDEIQTGIPRTPGYEPNYGETMKDQPQMPPSSDPNPAPPNLDKDPDPFPNRDPDPDPDPPTSPPSAMAISQAEPLAEAISPDSRISEFDKALEALQQQRPEQSQEHDKGHDR